MQFTCFTSTEVQILTQIKIAEKKFAGAAEALMGQVRAPSYSLNGALIQALIVPS
jgi:hypothetical protein